jgi:hypothetical protein
MTCGKLKSETGESIVSEIVIARSSPLTAYRHGAVNPVTA